MLPHSPKSLKATRKNSNNKNKIRRSNFSKKDKAKDKVKFKVQESQTDSPNKVFKGIMRTIEAIINGDLTIDSQISDDKKTIRYRTPQEFLDILTSGNKSQRGRNGLGRSLNRVTSKRSSHSVIDELKSILNGEFELASKQNSNQITFIDDMISRLHRIYNLGNGITIKKQQIKPNQSKAALILALGCIHPCLSLDKQQNREMQQTNHAIIANFFINNFQELPEFIIKKLTLKQLQACIDHVREHKQNHYLALSLIDVLIEESQSRTRTQQEIDEIDIKELFKYCQRFCGKTDVNHGNINPQLAEMARRLIQHLAHNFAEHLPNSDNIQKITKLYQERSKIHNNKYESDYERNADIINNTTEILVAQSELAKRHAKTKTNNIAHKKLLFPSLKAWQNHRPKQLADLDESIANVYKCPGADENTNMLVHRVTMILTLLINIREKFAGIELNDLHETVDNLPDNVRHSITELTNYCVKFLRHVYNTEISPDFINNLIVEFQKPQYAITQWQPNVLLAMDDTEAPSFNQPDGQQHIPTNAEVPDESRFPPLMPEVSHYTNEIIPLKAIRLRRLLLNNMLGKPVNIENFFHISSNTIKAFFELFKSADKLYLDYLQIQDDNEGTIIQHGSKEVDNEKLEHFRKVIIESLFYTEDFAENVTLKAFFSIIEKLNLLYQYSSKKTMQGCLDSIEAFIETQKEERIYETGFDYFKVTHTKSNASKHQTLKLNINFDYDTFIKSTCTNSEKITKKMLIEDLFSEKALIMHNEFIRFNQVFLTNNSREAHRLIIYQKRLMTLSMNKKGIHILPADTATLTSHGNVHRAALVWDHEGQMFYHQHSENDAIRFFHSSFLGDKKLLFSGEITLDNGFITGITDHSGHYKPSDAHLYQFILYLKQNGVDLFNCIIFRNVYIGDTPIDVPSVSALDFEEFFDLKQNIIKPLKEQYGAFRSKNIEHSKRAYLKMVIKKLEAARSPQKFESILRHFYYDITNNKATKVKNGSSYCKKLLANDKDFVKNLARHCSNAKLFSDKAYKNLITLIRPETKLDSLQQEVIAFIQAIENRLNSLKLDTEKNNNLMQLLAGAVKTISAKDDNLIKLKNDINGCTDSFQVIEFIRRFATLIEFYNNSCSVPELTNDFRDSAANIRSTKNKKGHNVDTIKRVKVNTNKIFPHSKTLFQSSDTESDNHEIDPYKICPLDGYNTLINDLAICLYAVGCSSKNLGSEIDRISSYLAYSIYLISALENHYYLDIQKITNLLFDPKHSLDMPGVVASELVNRYHAICDAGAKLKFPSDLKVYIYQFAEANNLTLQFFDIKNKHHIHNSVLCVNQDRIYDSSLTSTTDSNRESQHEELEEQTQSELDTSGDQTPRSDVSETPSLRAFINDIENTGNLSGSTGSLDFELALIDEKTSLPWLSPIEKNSTSTFEQDQPNGPSEYFNTTIADLIAKLEDVDEDPDDLEFKELGIKEIYDLLNALPLSDAPNLSSVSAQLNNSQGPSRSHSNRANLINSSSSSHSTSSSSFFGVQGPSRNLSRIAFKEECERTSSSISDRSRNTTTSSSSSGSDTDRLSNRKGR